METGIIQSIKDDKIIILVDSIGECQSCAGNKICGTGNANNKIIEIINTDPSFKVGDKVNIEFKPKIRVLSAIILFFIPLIILIAFYYIGFLFFKKENISILISFFGFTE